MYHQQQFSLSVTTQGPTYPPSEAMDENENFIVIGRVNQLCNGQLLSPWDAALVSKKSDVPTFGEQAPYKIIRKLSLDNLGNDANIVLHTLPLPLPCNNYQMVFAPLQNPNADQFQRKSYPFHKVPLADFRIQDGRKLKHPITLGSWVQAQGMCSLTIPTHQKTAIFNFKFSKLIPDSLYTIMALREGDLDPRRLTRPGPLGVPNVFITNKNGDAFYEAELPNPFPDVNVLNRNRIINVVVLWMSSQASYAGAIGLYGLGGDVHAQLKLKSHQFDEFVTRS